MHTGCSLGMVILVFQELWLRHEASIFFAGEEQRLRIKKTVVWVEDSFSSLWLSISLSDSFSVSILFRCKHWINFESEWKNKQNKLQRLSLKCEALSMSMSMLVTQKNIKMFCFFSVHHTFYADIYVSYYYVPSRFQTAHFHLYELCVA